VPAAGKTAADFDQSIRLRPMTAADVGRVPIADQGDPGEVLQRIADAGSSAILAFDGDRHVGQLQFRRYRPGVKSPRGLHDPLYWGDFDGHAPDLPGDSLAIFATTSASSTRPTPAMPATRDAVSAPSCWTTFSTGQRRPTSAW
jgi:hypothetical protein